MPARTETSASTPARRPRADPARARGSRRSRPAGAARRRARGEAVHEELRRRQPDALERVGDGGRRSARADPVDHERLGDGGVSKAGIERLVRILVDDLHPPAEPAQVVVTELRDIGPSKRTLPLSAWTSRRTACAVERLAAARLADERDHLALRDGERHPGHGVHVGCGRRRTAPESPRGTRQRTTRSSTCSSDPRWRSRPSRHGLQGLGEVACADVPGPMVRSSGRSATQRPWARSQRGAKGSPRCRGRAGAERPGSRRRRRDFEVRRRGPEGAACTDAASRGRARPSALLDDPPGGMSAAACVQVWADRQVVVTKTSASRARRQVREEVEDLGLHPSSAVVGSSASRTRGLHESAIAIAARWRIPPESSCG